LILILLLSYISIIAFNNLFGIFLFLNISNNVGLNTL
jgi:hypothetical protein